MKRRESINALILLTGDEHRQAQWGTAEVGPGAHVHRLKAKALIMAQLALSMLTEEQFQECRDKASAQVEDATLRAELAAQRRTT